MGRRRFVRDCSGAAASEFALVLPLLAVIFLNVADFGIYLYSKMQVDLAAQEAVGAARVLCDESTVDKGLPATLNCTDLTTTMEAAAETTSLGSNVTLSGTNEAWYCSDDTGTLDEVAAANGTAPADCSGTLAGSTAAPGIYISTTASMPFTPVFPGVSIAAVLPASITGTAWMRLK